MHTLTVQIPRDASGAQRQAVQLRLTRALARRTAGDSSSSVDRVIIRDIPPYAWGDAAEPLTHRLFPHAEAS